MSKVMEDDFSWSHEKTCMLIFLLENNPCLYNTRLVEYKDRNKRNEAFAEIASKLRITVTEVVKKIRGLRSQYAREKHKEPFPGITGAGAEAGQSKSKWVYFSMLRFLDEFTTVKRNRPILDPNMSEYQEQENEDNHYPIVINENIPENNAVFEDTTVEIDCDNFDQQSEDIVPGNTFTENACHSAYQKNHFPRAKRQRRDMPDNSVLEKTFTFLERVSSSSRGQPEWDTDGDIIFGRYVTSELKDIKDVQVKRMLKNRIQNLIFEAHNQQSANL